MRCRKQHHTFTTFAIILAIGSLGQAQQPDSIDFFENRIRPVLVKHCYECHSTESDEIGGSLLLDSQGGMKVGGDSGPAFDVKDANASLLLSALRYESTEMPPDGKLSDAIIQDFQHWIEAGAIDPRTQIVPSRYEQTKIDLDEGKLFWAFQPMTASPPSSVSVNAENRIDSYLQDRFDEEGVVPNSFATPSSRLRRLAFDLTGLPPSPSIVNQWMNDPNERVWNRIIDSLLASPAFAEHWARHWMDVARYADSNGSDFNATHHEAWRYRDYLFRSFATDRPFDQMIAQQVAGDLMDFDNAQERYDNVVATTFLMLGTKMLSERDKTKLRLDVVDEQIDTIGRAFLGLTLGCARCHDHKFDPIPTEDYYALAGIFKSTVTLKGESQKYVSTWNRVALPVSASDQEAHDLYQRKSKSLSKQLAAAERELLLLRKKNVNELPGILVDDEDAKKTGKWKPSTYFKDFVGPGYVHDDNKNKGELSIEYSARLPESGLYEVRFSYAFGSTRSNAVPITIYSAEGEKVVTIDQRSAPIAPVWRSLGMYRFSKDEDAVVTVRNDATTGYVIADAVQFLIQNETASQEFSADAATADADADAAVRAEQADLQSRIDQLKAALRELKTHAPKPLPKAMAPADVDESELSDSPVHIRGEARNTGQVIPRGFLQVCSPGDARINNPRGSGRLELVDWLTDPDNPLVARVFVNRVWMHLMGQGIVRTVDNFGLQGERPTHPELLDALASDFIRNGWQLKPLIRQIVQSAAYQRSSQFDESKSQADPENRLLWRFNRRRITAESIRDAMLATAGRLDRRGQIEPMAGRGTLVSKNNAASQATFAGVGESYRSVYLPTVRGYIPPLMQMLDVADPDLLVGRRPTTNVPSQSLVLINSPEVNQWATEAATRITNSASQFDVRLRRAFWLTLQREMTSTDRELAINFFAGREDSLDAWKELVAAIYASTEFRLLD